MKKIARVDIGSLKPLEQFIGSNENPKYFFTMTEIKKIGINPRTHYDTPAAVCSYPLTQDYYNKLIRKYGEQLPFAGGSPYICLFTISDKVNVMTSYSESDLEKDIKTLKRWFPEIVNDQFINNAFTSSKNNTPICKFWNLTRLLAKDNFFSSQSKTPMSLGQTTVQKTQGKDWAHLLRNLGYTNFYDPGIGLLHNHEPYQFMVFDTSIIVPIETYLNPFGYVSFTEVADPNRPGKTIMEPIQRIEEADKDIFYRKTFSSSIFSKANERFFSFIEKNIKNNNIPVLLNVIINSNNNDAKKYLIIQIFNQPNFVTNYQSFIKNILENNIANYEMKIIISSNLNKITDKTILDILSTDPDGKIRIAVASNTNNEALLKKLSTDPDKNVRITVINKTNNDAILDTLSTDTERDVRLAVAQKTNNDAILDTLSADPDPSVRSSVIYNTNNQAIVEKLSTDPHPDVKAAVAKKTKNKDLLQKLSTDPDSYVRAAAADNINNNEAILDQLSTDLSNYVRQSVAYRTNNENLLERLSTDPDRSVREGVLFKTKSEAVLEILSKDNDPGIREDAKYKLKSIRSEKLLTQANLYYQLTTY